ncbi:hypothetical protein SARC_11560, partial [Sphaeroforma arctica JP610]
VIGLPISLQTDRFVELGEQGGSTITIKEVQGESFVGSGYSPFINVTVPDVNEVVTAAMMGGAQMDGPIKHQLYGKVASIRSPDGQMIGLYEPAETTG